jgi:5-methylcytosine-specific restriction endonuclease McrA
MEAVPGARVMKIGDVNTTAVYVHDGVLYATILPTRQFITSAHRREIVRRSREKNKAKYADKKKLTDKEYYKKNHSKVIQTQSVYREKNRKKINKQSQSINKERLKKDPTFRLTCLMRTRLKNFLRGKIDVPGHAAQMVGCTMEHLKAHLGNKKGQIDHVFPLSKYDLSAEQHKMSRWENLQMLSAEENNEKNNRLPTKAMAANVPVALWPQGITEDMLPDIYQGWATPLSKY